MVDIYSMADTKKAKSLSLLGGVPFMALAMNHSIICRSIGGGIGQNYRLHIFDPELARQNTAWAPVHMSLDS